jgi:hypothetical protein
MGIANANPARVADFPRPLPPHTDRRLSESTAEKGPSNAFQYPGHYSTMQKKSQPDRKGGRVKIENRTEPIVIHPRLQYNSFIISFQSR